MKRMQQTGRALDCEVFLTLVLPDTFDSKELFGGLWSQINQFEQMFSRFLPHSELTNFNFHAGEEIGISPELRRILLKSKLMSRKTGGLYNPFILPALQKAGYVGSFDKSNALTSSPDFSCGRVITDYEKLTILKNTAKIPTKTALDFGGIGKGYLLDQLSKFLERQGVSRYWLSLGGDIICNGLDVDERPWQIIAVDALTGRDLADKISNDGKRRAIATSGIIKRQGKTSGKKWHHLIDPKTARPASTDILSATVVADEAAFADVAAKCLVIAGRSEAEKVAKLLLIRFMLLQLRSDDSSQTAKNVIKKYFRGIDD